MKALTILTKVKRVANNKLQAELQDFGVQLSNSRNVLSELNEGDEDFQRSGKPRYAWFPVTIKSLSKLGISEEDIAKIDELEYKQSHTLNIPNVELNGERLRIQVVESAVPFNPYQKENAADTAKKLMIDENLASSGTIKTSFNLADYIGDDGYFVTENGNFIFSKTVIKIDGEVNHVVVEPADFVPETELGEHGATLAEPVSVEETETQEA